MEDGLDDLEEEELREGRRTRPGGTASPPDFSNFMQQFLQWQATQASTTRIKTGALKLHHPGSYNGDVSRWEEWSYKYMSYMGLAHANFTTCMRTSTASTTEILDSAITQEQVELSRVLHHSLVSLTTGPAAAIVRQVTTMNGFETWRRLRRSFLHTNYGKLAW